MELERDVLVSPTGEVPVIEGEVVTAIRTLADRGVGKKTIAREVGVAVNTVRRYLRQPIAARRPASTGRAASDRRVAAGGTVAVHGAGGRQCGRRPATAGRARTLDQRAHARARGGGHPAGAPSRAVGDGARRNGTGRAAANRFWPEAAADCRHAASASSSSSRSSATRDASSSKRF